MSVSFLSSVRSWGARAVPSLIRSGSPRQRIGSLALASSMVCLLLAASSCGGGATNGNLGEPHQGQYHLGPVDFAETQFHNACAPAGGYRKTLRDAVGLGGEYIAGISNQFGSTGSGCDACIMVKTATNRSIVLRLVTYGVENEPGDIDVSPSAYSALNTSEYPRTMTWEYTHCPDTGGISYEFQTEANIWWTSLWVRNAGLPLTKVEVKSSNHASFFELRRASDGTFNDDHGFGEGVFTLRLTTMDGQVLTHDFESFSPGKLVETSEQFK